jgi:hypothetical protein
MKKPFKDMTWKEIQSLTDEEFFSYSPAEKRDCNSCKYIVCFVTPWCENQEAVLYNGTAIPGYLNCRFWEEKKPFFQKVKERISKWI